MTLFEVCGAALLRSIHPSLASTDPVRPVVKVEGINAQDYATEAQQSQRIEESGQCCIHMSHRLDSLNGVI